MTHAGRSRRSLVDTSSGVGMKKFFSDQLRHSALGLTSSTQQVQYHLLEMGVLPGQIRRHQKRDSASNWSNRNPPLHEYRHMARCAVTRENVETST